MELFVHRITDLETIYCMYDPMGVKAIPPIVFAEEHQYSAYLGFRILVCRDPHGTLPQTFSSEAARRYTRSLVAALDFGYAYADA